MEISKMLWRKIKLTRMDFDLGDFTIDKRMTDLVILTLNKK